MTTAAAANAGLGGVGGGAGAGGVPAAGGRPRSGMDDTLAVSSTNCSVDVVDVMLMTQSKMQSLENLIRLDTEATVGDLELLVRVNQHAAQRYRAMADAAEGLSVDAEYLSGKCKFHSSFWRDVGLAYGEGISGTCSDPSTR